MTLYFRYRHEFKSKQLWAEIKFVLDNFAQPFTELFNVSNTGGSLISHMNRTKISEIQQKTKL